MSLRLLLLAALTGTSCWGAASDPLPPNASEHRDKPYVLMIGLDGFRHDYTETMGATNVLAVRDAGARVDRFVPVFPSSTFPNFYSMATGLKPQDHGIVAMRFWDPVRREEFQYNAASAADPTWYEGTPLWVLAERQNMRAASYFWVGSDRAIQGVTPSHWFPYDAKTSHQDRVRKVLEWFRMPEESRPHLVTLYFADIDSAGHRFGPESAEVKQAVRAVDASIGELLRELQSIRPAVNVILVSDHGMDQPRKPIDLGTTDEFIGFQIVHQANALMLHSNDRALVDRTLARLRQNARGYKVYRRSEVPPHLHYSKGPRIGDIVIIPDGPDWLRIQAPGAQVRPLPAGYHGWDPTLVPTMNGIFYAAGPQIRSGARVRTASADAVYALVVKLLGLNPPPGQKLNTQLNKLLK